MVGSSPQQGVLWLSGTLERKTVVHLVKRTCLLSMALVLALACVVSAQDSSTQKTSAMSQAAGIVDEIIQAISQGDYLKFTSRFSPSLKQSQDREAFLQLQRNIQKSLGRLTSTEYLGFYVQQGNVITLFKSRFSKQKDDVLIKLV